MRLRPGRAESRILTSELSTVFPGGLFLLVLLAAVCAAREIVLLVVLAFVLYLLLALALRVLERLRAPRMLATCSR
jgi:predicted PurR-regulated permease PerM